MARRGLDLNRVGEDADTATRGVGNGDLRRKLRAGREENVLAVVESGGRRRSRAVAASAADRHEGDGGETEGEREEKAVKAQAGLTRNGTNGERD